MCVIKNDDERRRYVSRNPVSTGPIYVLMCAKDPYPRRTCPPCRTESPCSRECSKIAAWPPRQQSTRPRPGRKLGWGTIRSSKSSMVGDQRAPNHRR